MFAQDLYRISVPESLPIPSSVLRVIIHGPDEGVSAQITYFFIRTGDAVRQLFKLESKTGELTADDKWDFEERASYTTSVEAQGESHTAHCTIQLAILDENTNALRDYPGF